MNLICIPFGKTHTMRNTHKGKICPAKLRTHHGRITLSEINIRNIDFSRLGYIDKYAQSGNASTHSGTCNNDAAPVHEVSPLSHNLFLPRNSVF